MQQTLRLIILLFFVPTALLPVRLDVCLACLFGVEKTCAESEGEDEGDCCCCADQQKKEAPRSCCAARAQVEQGSGPRVESTPPPTRDCCLHIDNTRDELPAPGLDFSLPPRMRALDLALIQPSAPVPVAARPAPEPASSPPPEAPLPLLI